VDISC